MADKMTELIENEELRLSIKQNAVHYTYSRSWDSIYTNLFKQYRTVIEDVSQIPIKKSA